MAKLIFGLSQSLDGYVDHLEMRPGPALFRHFVEHVRDLAGSVYGRRTYEIMRYWDEDLPEWDAEELDFAAAWRSQPKWVVSRSLKSVGPNATLVQNDVGTVLRELKARLVGEIDVAGPDLARSLTDGGPPRIFGRASQRRKHIMPDTHALAERLIEARAGIAGPVPGAADVRAGLEDPRGHA